MTLDHRGESGAGGLRYSRDQAFGEMSIVPSALRGGRRILHSRILGRGKQLRRGTL
jgi:hypothetical protein